MSFDGGVRPSVQEQVRTCVQKKLMTDHAVGPGGSLNSLDLFNIHVVPLITPCKLPVDSVIISLLLLRLVLGGVDEHL